MKQVLVILVLLPYVGVAGILGEIDTFSNGDVGADKAAVLTDEENIKVAPFNEDSDAFGIPISADELTQEMVYWVNQYRKMNGCKPLAFNEKMTRAATYHAKKMERHGFFGHESPIAGEPYPGYVERAEMVGYNYSVLRENLVYFTIPNSFHDQWVEKLCNEAIYHLHWSRGHRKNMQSKDITEMGVGFAFRLDAKHARIEVWVVHMYGQPG